MRLLKKFLAAITYVSFLLWATSCQSHKVVSKVDDQLYCQSDKDCRVVEKACGEKAAINANHVKAFEKRISEITEIVDCSQFWGVKQKQDGALAVCKQNKCSLELVE